MDGFDALSAGTAMERADVTGVPAWQDGAFRFGGAAGTVRRRAEADAVGWGPPSIGSEVDAVRVGEAARFGTMSFRVVGAGDAGVLEGRCRYARTEARGRLAGGIDAAAPLMPLRLSCAYRLDGRDAGGLEVGAAPGPGAADTRTGRVTLNGATLGLESSHGVAGTPLGSGAPVGYVARAADGRVAAAVELTAGVDRRVLLPRDGAERQAAAAAMVTLALFRDPGDVD